MPLARQAAMTRSCAATSSGSSNFPVFPMLAKRSLLPTCSTSTPFTAAMASTLFEVRIAAAHRALSDGRKLASIDRTLGFLRRVDVGIDDAHRAVVEQERYVGIVDAADAHQWRDAARHCSTDNVADGLEVEQRVLAIDEEKVVARRFGDAGDIAGTPKPYRHAKCDVASLHTRLDRVGELM